MSTESSSEPLSPGTVTFLFTDVEGSTRLWEQFPKQMGDVLARHEELIVRMVEAHGGHVFKLVGDGCCAAFQTAPAGLEAAIASQTALEKEVWPEGIRLAARMAVHTGSVEFRGGDYFGQTLSRVTRLLSVGHGGQILVSDVTRSLCLDALPDGVSMRPLGQHRLKDLGRPEKVFQVSHPGLRQEFPPLRSLENLPNNLPKQLTSFIGREREVAHIQELLVKARLLTLTGAGGCGKTRLALQVASQSVESYADGAWFVELAAVSEPDLAPRIVAATFGLKEELTTSVVQRLTAYLEGKRLLLVLDNCEHLLSACAELAYLILRKCPFVTLLATSRERLSIAGETTYRVPSLSLPDPKEKLTAQSLSEFEAASLFVERAQSLAPEFRLTDENASPVAAVCRHLDGIPLAIELAAARVRSMSIDDVNRRLDQRFRLLTGGSRTVLPRLQTLRALMDWSYDLLTDREKALFRRLSVFNGSWTLEAAEKICHGDGIDELDVLDLVSSLTDKSLVTAEERLGASRYRFLETVRQYAADRLEESGEQARWRNLHVEHFLALARAAEPQIVGPEVDSWLARLEAEHDNLRWAMDWAVKNEGAVNSGLRLAGSLWEFWHIRGFAAEGRSWLASLLDAKPDVPDGSARVLALTGAMTLALLQYDYTAARAAAQECLALSEQLDDRRGMASARLLLAMLAFGRGDYEQVLDLSRKALDGFRKLGDRRGMSSALMQLSWIAIDQGELAKAALYCDQALEFVRQLGDRRGMADALRHSGWISYLRKEYVQAKELHEEVLAI